MSEYVDRLLPISDAAKKYGMSKTAFWRFRRRHKLATLPGRRVHEDDVIAAMNRERGIPSNPIRQ